VDIGSVNASLTLWAETQGGDATLINVSENHTFRIDLPSGGRFILRVHRPGYQSAAAIESELEWLNALRAETPLPVPRPLPGRDGGLLQELHPKIGASRRAVLFAYETGVEPQPQDDLGDLFETLGRFAAIAHLQAMDFTPSASFRRPVWTAGAILDASGLWGDWRRAPHVEGDVAATLAALDLQLRAELAAYGQGRDRFGLIHADMRLANLLVDGDRVTLIDFDDCGFCWFLYDFAAAISFFEDSPSIPVLKGRWLSGYEAIRPLTPTDRTIIETMVLLRRMALLAWIGSHAETDLAQSHAPNFAKVTAALAAPYLDRRRV
jgi:Ser/Thr protein kinase RdoA (MazF antagonist)